MAAAARPPTPANRLGLDYRAEAAKLGRPVVPIIDAHTHIHGEKASRVYDEARQLFGVVKTYSMTQIGQAPTVRDALGDSIRFIAIPTWSDPDKASAHGMGYVKTIERFRRDFDSRIMKIWGSPRLRDIVPGVVEVRDVDSPARIAACEAGRDLGMMYMVHIADPDTWFATKYADPAKYGTKRSHYEALERMLDRFTNPWIAAHMGGWPEDLGFLDGLLSRHDNLYIDTSATKWVVRELSKHPVSATRAFFEKWGGGGGQQGRVLFGSDLVVMEDQLSPAKTGVSPMSDLADSPESAFELYASRYWALRTMFETSYDGESPIADPDLMMVEPAKYNAMSGPRLRGMGLDRELLSVMYAGAAERLVEGWWAKND